MSTPTVYCASGCVVRGQHRQTCETRDREVDPCKGCLPRAAEYGNLCAFCFQRLQSDVATAPALVAHLREIGEPYAQVAPPSDTRTYRDPAEGGILHVAWGAADEIHADLASWALLILEEHPNGSQMRGPDETGAWHTRYGTTVGVVVAEATVRLCTWLRPLLPWCAAQEWAAEMRREVGALIATTSARWPMQDSQARAVVGVRCARCGFESLDYTPTKGADLPFDVRCVNPECGRIYTEAEWDAALAKMTVERGYVA
ncbi:MAG: hypothetical protein JJE50_01650 [Actinomycetales bacterium]|nr:hypothetical protein [Actinomycetales bacterium]